MNALEIDIIPSSFRSMVHGVIIPAVNMSPLNSHYSDINILGADFLARRGFRVDLDYGLATIRIYPSD